MVTKTQCLKVYAVSVSYDDLFIHLRERDILENFLKKYCMKRAGLWKLIVSLYCRETEMRFVTIGAIEFRK